MRHALEETTSQKLRFQNPPVIGRVNDDVLLLDPRSVLPEEDDIVIKALGNAITDLM